MTTETTKRRGGFGFRKPVEEKSKTAVVAQSNGATKLIKKGKKGKQSRIDYSSDPDALRRHVSKLLMTTLAEARETYQDPSIAAAGDAGKIVIGIPVPFAFQYLTQNDVLPLGRMIQVVGVEGTCKSSLCFEFARWFGLSCGMTYLFENETKFSSDFAESILGYADELDVECFGHVPCHSVEDWQIKLQGIAGDIRTRMTEKGGIGRTYPVLLLLDSIMGKLAEESQTKIEESGHSGRSFPAEALLITSFLKKFPQDLEKWPMTFVAVNHLKPGKDDRGLPTRNKAGGRQISFQETYEFEMQKGERSKINMVDETGDSFEIGGKRLRIACKKNSLGETDRAILISIIWLNKKSLHGDVRQYTKWDWQAATIDILKSYSSGVRKEKIDAIVDIRRTKGDRYWSKRLKVSSKAPLPKHDIGALLEKDPQIVSQLQALFGIKVRKKFQPGVDYLKQLAVLQKRIIEKLSKE